MSQGSKFQPDNNSNYKDSTNKISALEPTKLTTAPANINPEEGSSTLDPSKVPTPPKEHIEEPTQTKKDSVPFWSENPNVLLQKEYILEFFPTEDMTYNQKMNAVTRIIILLIAVGFIMSRNIRIVLIGLITLGGIYLMHFYHEKEANKMESKKITKSIQEGFEGPAKDYYSNNGISIPQNVFTEPDSSNPFSNVLVTDYEYNPNKKPAPPAYNQNINNAILQQAKNVVSESNPDQPDITDKLFRDLGEQLQFEQSLRPFNSNPATTIPNDQAAFADFCYGSMVSCKEGNKFACARNLSHYTLY